MKSRRNWRGQGGHWPPQIFQDEVKWWFAGMIMLDKVFYYWPLQNFVASAGPELNCKFRTLLVFLCEVRQYDPLKNFFVQKMIHKFHTCRASSFYELFQCAF